MINNSMGTANGKRQRRVFGVVHQARRRPPQAGSWRRRRNYLAQGDLTQLVHDESPALATPRSAAAPGRHRGGSVEVATSAAQIIIISALADRGPLDLVLDPQARQRLPGPSGSFPQRHLPWSKQIAVPLTHQVSWVCHIAAHGCHAGLRRSAVVSTAGGDVSWGLPCRQYLDAPPAHSALRPAPHPALRHRPHAADDQPDHQIAAAGGRIVGSRAEARAG